MSTLEEKIKVANDIDFEAEKTIKIGETERKLLWSQTWMSLCINNFILLGVYIVLTCALYGWGQDLSKGSFTAFMIVMLLWLIIAALYIIKLPLWQGRKSIVTVMRRILGKDINENTLKLETCDESLSSKSYRVINKLSQSSTNDI